MAGNEQVERQRAALAAARGNRSVLDSPLKKAGQWVFDTLYGSGEPNPADFAMPMSAPGKQALTKPAEAMRQAAIRILKPVKAFHGSPFNFDQFKLRPREGQGAATFGEGLYFAEAPRVAEKYARELTHERIYNKLIDQSNPGDWSIADALEYYADSDVPVNQKDVADFLRGRLSAFEAPDWTRGQPHAVEASKSGIKDAIRRLDADPTYLEKLIESVPSLARPQGHRYEVNLHVDPQHELLDWDLPLREQSQTVRRALYEEGMPARDIRNWGDKMSGADAYARFAKLRRANAGRPPNERLDFDLPLTDALSASKGLNERGVAGISYLDQFSRRAGKGTSNYVMFDPARVELVRKYGLAGAAGTAGLGELLYGDQAGRQPGTVTKIR